MSLVATIQKQHKLESGLTMYAGTLAYDSSYPTGGEPLDFAGNERVDFLLAAPAGGFVYLLDAAAQKLLVYYGDNNNAADGALIQVPDTTDLSALTATPFIAFGS